MWCTFQILAQREFPIGSDTYMPDLHSALSQLGADLLLDTVENLKDRLEKAQPQDDKMASYGMDLKLPRRDQSLNYAIFSTKDNIGHQ